MLIVGILQDVFACTHIELTPAKLAPYIRWRRNGV